MSAREIDVVELADRLGRGDDVVVIDVRSHGELAMAEFSGAVHIPMDEIEDTLADLDPDREYAVLCHHGIRSLSAVALLHQAGIERARSVRGGIDAWSRRIDPRIPRY